MLVILVKGRIGNNVKDPNYGVSSTRDHNGLQTILVCYPAGARRKIYLLGGLQHETLRKCGKMDDIMMEMRSTKITILSVCGGSRAQSGKLTSEGIT